MCMAIYAILFALLLFYSDYVIEQYALSVTAGEQQWMVAAIGWEILPMLWPLVLLLMVAASGMTLFAVRWFGNRRTTKEARH